jgi:alpha,alpha-trehalose phosphorylase
VHNYSSPDDPRLGEGGCYLRPDGQLIQKDASFLVTKTSVSGLRLCTGVAHALSHPAQARQSFDAARHKTTFRFSLRLSRGERLRLTKYAVFADSVREADCLSAAQRAMARAFGHIDEAYEAQRAYLRRFWESADASIDGNDGDDRSMRFNLYQLLQAAGRDGLSSIAAKGLSGEGYEGHYFWDTEMYMMPFFTLTMPGLARKLLGYRYSILEKARENARLLGHKKGALYPWRTIAGRECGGYFPSGTAQYHIDGDIAYAVAAYYLATGDLEYLKQEGAEILLETARLWADVGSWYHGTFRINDVTGPDEYTCIVNNNYYTNACARHNLRWAVKATEILKAEGGYSDWAGRLHVTEVELDGFTRAADNMFLPYDEDLGINPQDDSFLQKPVWDFAATPQEHHPLLMYYHPLTLYRFQVCKQADTVLAYCLFDDLESPDVMRRSFEYYEKITTHDSSLSNCVFAIAACRLGFFEKALAYFGDSLGLDLLDTHHNTKDGVHTANMGGCYMAMAQGFAGLHIREDGPHLDPILPARWSGYRFRFQYLGSSIQFQMDGSGASVTLLQGAPVKLCLNGAWIELDQTG